MENIGAEWRQALSKRIGGAVQARRKALGMSAQQLADKCAELELPIHRVTVTKIEAGRSGFDLGDLIAIAVALDVPPIALVYPNMPDGLVEYVPGQQLTAIEAVARFTGESLEPRAPAIDELTSLSRDLALTRHRLRRSMEHLPVAHAKNDAEDVDATTYLIHMYDDWVSSTAARLRKIPGAVVGERGSAGDSDNA